MKTAAALIIASLIVLMVGLYLISSSDSSDENLDRAQGISELEENTHADNEALKQPSEAPPQKEELTSPFDSQSNEDNNQIANKEGPLDNESLEKVDEQIEQMEVAWDVKMEELFSKELGLSQRDYQDYTVMRHAYDEDRLEAFEDFHNEMSEKYGDDYSFSPTEEMKVYEQKIRQEYEDLFRKRFGDEAFAHYVDARESFNDENRRRQGDDSAVLYIEF